MSEENALRRRGTLAAEAVDELREAEKISVHPITLRVSDGTIDRAFATRSFGEAFSLNCLFSLICIVLFALIGVSVPALHASLWASSVVLLPCCFLLTAVATRVWVDSAADQVKGLSAADAAERAHRRFSWAWCIEFALWWFLQFVMSQRAPFVTGLSVILFGGLCGMYLLLAYFQRFMGIKTVPRLVVLGCSAALHVFMDTPASVIGKPGEGMCVIAALLVGELIGHPIEMHRRLVFVQGQKIAIEQKFVASELEAEKIASKNQSDMAAYVFHQLRNDQNVICGALDMFGEDVQLAKRDNSAVTLSPKTVDALLAAQQHAFHSSQVVLNMMDFSKFRAGELWGWRRGARGVAVCASARARAGLLQGRPGV